MAAVAGFPSLSQLLSWPTEHLTEAADHWEALGGRSYEVANQVWQGALSIDWQGDTAEALQRLRVAVLQTCTPRARGSNTRSKTPTRRDSM
jgi:hypothetical protein